jgi:LEA14-like dessication related protein
MRSWISFVACILLAVAATACEKPALPTFVPVKAVVNAVTPAGVDLTATLTATNPNRIEIPLREVTGHLVLHKTTDLGTITIPFPKTLPAGQTTTMDLPLMVPWKDLLALGQLAGLATDIPYTVDGTVNLGGDLINVEVPYHLEGTVTQAQLLDAARNSISAIPGMPGLRGLLAPQGPSGRPRSP